VTDAVDIGRPDDFREGRGRVVVVAGVRVAVFRVGALWFALGDACPHMGLSLADSAPEGGAVTCQGHGWTFDLRTGRSDRRSGACARVYDVWVDGDRVLVRAPAAPAADGAAADDDWPVWDDERHLRRPGEGGSGEPGNRDP
jgi:nitrite reductase/ring-hydroxylating ferredoxin subunit